MKAAIITVGTQLISFERIKRFQFSLGQWTQLVSISNYPHPKSPASFCGFLKSGTLTNVTRSCSL